MSDAVVTRVEDTQSNGLGTYTFPTHKLRKPSANKKPVVLISCGSFSPITNMHLRLFEMAAESFRDSEYEVIGQYISPVADAYGKKGLASAEHRIAMCTLATDATDIMVDDWEARVGKYTFTQLVLDHFEAELIKALGLRPDIHFICGSDLLDSFNTPDLWAVDHMEKILGEYGLVCLQREGTKTMDIIKNNPLIHKHASNIKLVDQWMDDHTSSRKLRTALSKGLSIRFYTPDPVVDYIKKHGLWGPDYALSNNKQ